MEIEQELEAIKQRNFRVEIHKAWETSFTRRFTLALLTYIAAEAWLLAIHEPKSWLKAFIPVAGYMLSTLSLPWVRKTWAKKYYGQNTVS